VPLLLTVSVLIALLPVTCRVDSPVTVSAAALPKTALPVTVRPLPAPTTLSRKVTLLPVRVVLAPSVAWPS
jgi:hypothetical protein